MAIGKVRIHVPPFEVEYETEEECLKEGDFLEEVYNHISSFTDELTDGAVVEALEFEPDEPESDELDTLDPEEENGPSSN